MEITILPKDYIITMTDFTVDMYYSDFMLRALRINNETNNIIDIEKLSFIVKKKDQVIKHYSYCKDALSFWIPKWNRKIRISDSHQREALIGAKNLWNYDALSNSTRLNPGEEIGLRNEYFHIIFDEFLDELSIEVEYMENSVCKNAIQNIPMIKYENKNKYTFPVKGIWQVNGNFDCLMGHRCRHSDEFALDLGKLDENHLTPNNKGMKDEDHACYGEKVYAIADGVVVQVYEEMKETTIGLSNEELQKLEAIHGYWPLITGNIVTLEHKGGEYSQYGHLQYHSINLKVGDKVKQGQVIGLVGNNGLSNGAHLHFQLSDGFDVTSRSLPCSFVNIRNSNGNPIEIISEEYTMVNAK